VLLIFPKWVFFADSPEKKISGYIKDKDGKKCVKLHGRWDDHLIGTWLVDTEDAGFVKGAKIQLWKAEPHDFTGKPYRMTTYAMGFNFFPENLQKTVLTSDSRRRLDRYWLEQGDCDKSTQWKRVAEYRQRIDENERKLEAKKKKGSTDKDLQTFHTKDYWTPNWFKLDTDHRGESFWTWNGTYWDIFKAVCESSKPHIPDNVKDTSCDFANYEKNFADLLGTSKPGDKGINLQGNVKPPEDAK